MLHFKWLKYITYQLKLPGNCLQKRRIARRQMLCETINWHSKDTSTKYERRTVIIHYLFNCIHVIFKTFYHLQSPTKAGQWMLVNFNNKPNNRIYVLPLIDCSPCRINVICHQFYFSGVIC